MIDLVKAGRLEFRDINDEPFRLADFGSSLDDIRKRLHALERHSDSERLLIGADVVIALWRRTSGQGGLAKLFGNPITRPITRLGYNMFAEVLFAWNKRRGHW